MVSRRMNPIKKLTSLIPRSQSQFESELKYVLKLAFWAALLAPVIIVPAYYLVLALVR
jgi:hypothetical protein